MATSVDPATETATRPLAAPRRVHGVMALVMLVSVIAACLAGLGLAHSPEVEARLRRARWEEASRTKNFYWPIGHIANDLDRVVNEEIPVTDHRHGGVYILGTSSMTWGLKVWDLPAEQRRLIHNDALVGTGHVGQGLLLRYLVEREGLLDAGPEKTLVVFGTGYQNISRPEDEKSFLSQALAERGFYDRGPGGSIERSGAGWLERTVSIERTRLYGFASGLSEHTRTLVRQWLGRRRPARVLNVPEMIAKRTQVMGPDWTKLVNEELAALMATIDDLKARGARVLVLQMPQGTWENQIPFDRAYNDQLEKLCHARNLDVLDLRKLADDDDFADSNHLTPMGVEKLHRALLPTCLEHLRSAGLLSQKAP